MASSNNGGRFASRTAFEALQIEEIESDEESAQEQHQVNLPAQPTTPAVPAPSKTVKKKSTKSGKTTAIDKPIAPGSIVTSSSQDTNDTHIHDTTADAASKSDESIARNGTNGVEKATPDLPLQRNVVPTPPAPLAATTPKLREVASTTPATPIPVDTPKPVSPQPQTDSILQASSTVQPASDKDLKAPEVPARREAKQQPETEDADAAKKAKLKKIYERTLFTLIMIGGFIGLLLMGHPYMILLVMVSQTLVYREVVALFNIPGRPSVTGGGRSSRMSSAPTSAATSEVEDDEDERIIKRAEGRRDQLWSKALSWYFFAVANYFLYGESIIYYFKHIVFVDAYFIPFARHHRFLSFMLYVFGFMAFVSNLKRRNLKHQFGLFCWVHMSLLLIVFSSHFIVNNILEGLIWFWVPASLVICNDVFAYICGMTFGRTPLIALSPKKTVEGFVGALVVTEIFAYGWATCFQRFNYMICPAVSLGMNAFKDITCDANPVFAWHYAPLPPAISALASSVVGHRVSALPWTAFQLHALVMAAFASLVAPFGGFFASGFKRAFNIKDFGDSIPGHGGLTDRFDCQFLMGLFSYVYYSSLIREHHVTVGTVLQTVVTQLPLEDQMELYNEIGRYLVGQGKLTRA
ncbi:hypothetical protein BCV70DRAFT_173113 [Testicularia cyperi]|uniref:Phosphatidate cytidylyltransferase n=1 Tax=Testicularia cyperi TaxID=1882483 RepID=A0A317XU81_9BASI|nr:hypothetical protein BCV70DRAFT_173113 [Testicularia cyperi]